MREERNIDFKRHTSPPVSKMYLLKIIFYVVLLSVVAYIILKGNDKTPSIQDKEITEIHHITLGK